jgi:NAD(P)-dependent dehydrogenase (short-subunit alcohol dehydrogenase family)
MHRLDHKVALITGAAGGIGQACAAVFAAEGACVIATDIKPGPETAAKIQTASRDSHFEPHDVTDEASWQRLIAAIAARHGRLDVLLNNAGIVIAVPPTEMTLEDWRRQQAVNSDSVFLGTKHSLPLMRRSGGGSIVNIASTAALKSGGGLVAYAGTKGNVRSFSRAMALYCAAARDSVRVNSIYPSIIDTSIYQTIEGLPQAAADGKKLLARDPDALAARFSPLGVKGRPEDIAWAAVYLASDESRYLIGAELVVDGGLSIT